MNKTINAIFSCLAVLSGLLLLFVTFSITFNIFARYLGFAGIIWGVQFTEYALLWMTLLGAAWVLQRGRHVSVDIVTNQLGPKANAYLSVVHSMVGIILCAVLCWYGTIVTWGQYRRGVTDIQVVDIPKYMVLIIIPVGFFFLTLQFGRSFFENLKQVKREKERISG